VFPVPHFAFSLPQICLWGPSPLCFIPGPIRDRSTVTYRVPFYIFALLPSRPEPSVIYAFHHCRNP
jgi:hypothetical protein